MNDLAGDGASASGSDLDHSTPPSSFSRVDEFLVGHQKQLTVAHINVNSLLANLEEMKIHILGSGFDVIAVSETWLKPINDDSFVRYDNYTLIRNDRVGQRGGGVAFYVRENIKHKLIFKSSPGSSVEQLWIEVCINHEKVAIGCIYKPPHINYSEFEQLEHTLSYVVAEYQHVLLLGDFNVNLYKTGDIADVSFLSGMSTTYGLEQLITMPTHHLRDTHTLIDHAYTFSNKLNFVKAVGQMSVPGVSHHDVIYLAYDLFVPKSKPKFISFRNMKKVNPILIKHDISVADWNSLEHIADMNDRVCAFNTLILNIFDTHAPLVKRRITRPPAPWITDDIKSEMKHRDNLRAKYYKYKDPQMWEDYKKWRNRIKQLINNSKKKYLNNLPGTHTSGPNTSELWNRLKLLGVVRNPKSHSTADNVIDFDKLVAHLTAANNIQTDATTLLTVDNFTNNVFCLKPVSIIQVLQAINSIKSNAAGIDGITLTMLKMCTPYCIPSLTNIINSSITTGQFPDLWKKAIVNPIPKGGDITDPKNYRPISILPVISKVIERLVHNQIVGYVQENKLFDTLQSGFRKQHGTCTALIKIVDDVLKGVDDGMVTSMVLLDFVKAFDSVQHYLLINKLKRYGFDECAVTWIKSYLSNRSQKIVFNELASDWIPLNVGVPQGSILGPLLFCLFINDLPTVLQHMNYHLYADDSQLYNKHRVDDIKDAYSNINNDVSNILKWSNENKMKINPAKSKHIIIGNYQQLRKFNADRNNAAVVKVGEEVLERCSQVKNLGLLFNQNLNWNAQVQSSCKRAYYILSGLYRHKDCLNKQLRVKLANSVVLSIFNYCFPVFAGLSVLNQKRIQRVQNACVRFILNLRKYDRITAHRKSLNWLSMHDRQKLLTGSLMYKITKNLAPNYLSLADNVYHDHSTRHVNNLRVPKHKTSRYHNSFAIFGIYLWNGIPQHIKAAATINQFKQMFFKYLLSEEG